MTMTYVPSDFPIALISYNDMGQLKKLIDQFNIDATTSNGNRNEWGKQEQLFKKDFFNEAFNYIFTNIRLRAGRVKYNRIIDKRHFHWTYKVTDSSDKKGNDLLDSITLIAKDKSGKERFRQELVFEL